MNMEFNIKFDKDYVIETTWDYSPMRKNTYKKTTNDKLEGRALAKAIQEKTKKLDSPSYRRYTSDVLTEEEKYHEVTHEYKKLFKKGSEFKLKNGINLFVGDNGCGKSTLMRLLLEDNKGKLSTIKVVYVDMENNNPKITKPAPDSLLDGYSVEEVMNQFMWNAESHGETREGVLMSVLTLDFDLLLMDEPEQGLSLKNQLKYINELKELGKPIIINTHSKVFIESVDEVFDVEIMKWVKTEEYLTHNGLK